MTKDSPPEPWPPQAGPAPNEASNEASNEVACITLKDKVPKDILMYFPQCRKVPAVDMRGVDAHELFRRDLISVSCYDTMKKGRRRDREFTSGGAVGLQQSVLLAFSTTRTRNLLLLEDDCYFKFDPLAEIQSLKANTKSFDVAMFGVYFKKPLNMLALEPVSFMPKGWYWPAKGSELFLTHCVFYTETGRSIVKSAFEKPQEMHIDSTLRILSDAGVLRVIVQCTSHTAQQSMHPSTIIHVALDCPQMGAGTRTSILTIFMLLFLALVVIARMNTRSLFR